MTEAQTRRASNRELMPNVAALIDDIRGQLGDIPFRIVHAKDFVTNQEVGYPPELKRENIFRIPENYFPCKSVEEILKPKATAKTKAKENRR